jgi:hypothetical protein
VGPLQFHSRPFPGQEHWLSRHRPWGSRRCLLKGCEHWFSPRHPQTRYCSVTCQQEARRWRRWRAGQRYRVSDGGQQQRREQSRRYRERLRQRQTSAAAQTQEREGQRAAQNPQESQGQPCDRPGCYQLFVPSPRSPRQHFCSCSCRLALRRVRQREIRQRQRRRQGVRPRRLRPRSPRADTS